MERKKTKPTRRQRQAAERAAAEQAAAAGGKTPDNERSGAVPPASARGFPRLAVLGAAGLCVMVAVSYLPALWNGFVWDDKIFSNEPVLREWSGLWTIWFDPAGIKKEGHYWPVVYSTFWLEHKLWGLAPLGYHLVNVVLHGVNTLLVWRLLGRLAVPGAWAVAAVFAVHPLHVESVAWIIERKDLVSGLFYLAAVLTWIRFTDAPEWRRYALALALFTAAMLSKTVVVTLPAALLIWHWWQRERVSSDDLLRLAPFFVVGLVITLGDLSFYASREPLALGYSFAERLLIASRALWFYAGKLLWPADLAVIYPMWDIRVDDPLAWAYVGAAALLPVLLWLGRRRLGRGPLAGALFYAVTLSPVLGFVDYGYMQFAFVADRFQYLACIGLLAVLVGGAAWGVGRLPDPFGIGARGALAGALALFAWLTWNQTQVYRDEVSLFSHIVSLNPEARDAHLNLGQALINSGRPDEAIEVARKAVRQRPDFAPGYSNVGIALLRLDRPEEAEEVVRRGLAVDPRHRELRQNLAEALRKQKRYEEATAAYRATLEIDSRYALAHAGLGASLFHLQRHEEAVASVKRSLSLEPRSPIAKSLHVILGQALEKTGHLDAAAEHYHRALEMDPSDPRPLSRLAQLRNAQGPTGEADGYLRQAHRMRPNDAVAHQYTAEVLRKRKRYEEALESYRAALAVAPEYAPAYAGVGTVMLAMKRYEEALEALSRSLELAPKALSAAARHVLAGRAAEHLERDRTAAEHYERARSLNPRNTRALERLAVLRFGQKRYEEALALYREMLDINPKDPRVHSNLGATLYNMGRPAEAGRRFERALALNPGLASARTGLEAVRRALAKERE